MKVMNSKNLYLIRKLSLMIFLSGCTSVVNGNPYGFCPLEVKASQQVKADFMKTDLSPETLKYLRDIGIQERDIEKYCK